MIPAFSGFDYDKNNGVLAFSPEESLMRSDGVFVRLCQALTVPTDVWNWESITSNSFYMPVKSRYERYFRPHRTYRVMFGRTIPVMRH